MREIIESFRPGLFANKCVLVSGASSGIGLSIARGFVSLGAAVTATGTSEIKLAKAAANVANSGISFASLDVRSRPAVDAFVGKLERLDVLVNAAGIARPEKEWEEGG